MTYGDKRDFPKIDISRRGTKATPPKYLATTTWAKTCKEAIARYAELSGYAASDLTANFQKR